MKFSQEAKEYALDLINIRENNINYNDMYCELFYYRFCNEKDDINDLMLNQGYTSKDAIKYKIEDFFEIAFEEESEIYVDEALKEEKEDEYLSNPYVKAINISHVKQGKYTLFKDKYEPFELFARDDIKVLDNYVEQPQIGYFTKPFSFLALKERDVTWMSLNPNEINTMKKGIERASGNVLVLGLGLGYFPFMISLKDDVKDITIIERNKDVIALFKDNILPNFKHKEKIHIIQDDAIRYVQKLQKDTSFDYIFADLWHNQEDALRLYITLVKEENRLNIPTDYWLETSILAYVRRMIIFVFLGQLIEGTSDMDYVEAATIEDSCINGLYFAMKDMEFTSKEQLKEFLSDASIKELLINEKI